MSLAYWWKYTEGEHWSAVCSFSLAGIASSNPAGGMDICLL
jgi:hypothetical protein